MHTAWLLRRRKNKKIYYIVRLCTRWNSIATCLFSLWKKANIHRLLQMDSHSTMHLINEYMS